MKIDAELHLVPSVPSRGQGLCFQELAPVALHLYNTSAIADARHQEVLPSANSISKYGVTPLCLCCARETFV